jgi:hypothetical protein
MQIVNQTAAKTSRDAGGEPLKLLKRIGSTTYEVTIRFSPDSHETLDDKIYRLIGNDMAGMPFPSPQTGKLPERSSL